MYQTRWLVTLVVSQYGLTTLQCDLTICLERYVGLQPKDYLAVKIYATGSECVELQRFSFSCNKPIIP